MEWTKAQKEKGLYRIPESWLYIHYYEALNVLFRVENSLRVFAYAVLKNLHLDQWTKVSISTDDAEDSTIEAIAKKRIRQNQDFGYLGYSILCPIMHLTSGELIRIFFNEKNWVAFQPYFKAKKDIIRTKLDEIGNVRNALAHFRPLRSDDVEVIKQNAKQVMILVEECLKGLSMFSNQVPTNTSDVWYQKIAPVKTDLLNTTFFQSNDEKWVKLQYQYSVPILNRPRPKEHRLYRVLGLKTSSILKRFVLMRKYVTYVSDERSRHKMLDDGTPEFKKLFGLVFDKNILNKHCEEINSELIALNDLIQNETKLIQKDNLVHGDLISPVQVWATLEKNEEEQNYWEFNMGGLACDVREDDPPEYWGNVGLDWWNIISVTQRYPWMPVDISDWEMPF